MLALVVLPAASAQAADPIMPLSQVQAGMQCMGKTVVSGTTISSFDVTVMGVVQEPPEGAMILVSVSGPAVELSGVAFGFSGSPIYCPGANGTPSVIGAISQGIGQYGNGVVLATPIQEMLDQPVLPPSSAPHITAPTHSLGGPLTVSGLSPALAGLLERAGQQAGRQVATAPVGGAPSYPVQALVPGASVGVSYSTGAIGLGAVGTVSYTDGSDVYAFGHELDGAGRRSLFLQDAYVYGVVDNPSAAEDGSYKLAAPGHVVGTLTSDNPYDVIGTLGAAPTSIPVNVQARDLDTGQKLVLDSTVADETGVGDPDGDLLDMVAPLAVAQAATQIYDGAPANESGSMCLHIDLRGIRAPLGFCNRYVASGTPGDQGETPPALALATGDDVSSALSVLDSVQFAALDVRSVTASIDAQRGLIEGTIVSARSLGRAVAGALLRVRLLVQRYQGAAVPITLRVRVPRGIQGPALLEIDGPSAGGSGSDASLAAALATVLGGGGSGSGSGADGGSDGSSSGAPPSSMAQLRSQIAAIAPYDGLTASFLTGHSHGRSSARRVYRDPALLITGKATVLLDVRR